LSLYEFVTYLLTYTLTHLLTDLGHKGQAAVLKMAQTKTDTQTDRQTDTSLTA